MTASGWSSACNSSNCVEVRRVGDVVEVRDSKLGEESEIIEYSLDDWSTQVIAEIRDGGWLPEESYREDDADGTVVLQRRINAKLQLRFTAAEWDAFVVGVRRGEFDDLTAEWRSAALADVDPDSGTHSAPQPASVELSADSGPVVSDVHPAVQAVRAAHYTPECGALESRVPHRPCVKPTGHTGFHRDAWGSCWRVPRADEIEAGHV